MFTFTGPKNPGSQSGSTKHVLFLMKGTFTDSDVYSVSAGPNNLNLWGSCRMIAGQQMAKLQTMTNSVPFFIQTLTVRVLRETLVL